MARATKESTAESTPLAGEPVEDGVGVVERQPLENPDSLQKSSGGVKVVCTRFAGRKVYGSDGLIEFDKDGAAFVPDAEARRLSQIPGFEVK